MFFSPLPCRRCSSERPPALRPATRDEIVRALAFAMRYPRRAHDSDDVKARIVAEQLVEYLERSGFVVMKRPDAKASGVP